MGENALQHQRYAEGQQQAVEMVFMGDGPHQEALHQNAQEAHHQRHHNQRHPVVHAEIAQCHPGEEGAQHVHRPLGEVDDLQQAEDDGQPQAEQGIEGPVDQAHEQLPEQGKQVDSEKSRHGLRHSWLKTFTDLH